MFKSLRRFFLWGLFCLPVCEAKAQTAGLPLHSVSYHLLERLEILNGESSRIHPEIKFFNRRDVAEFASMLDSAANPHLSARDRNDIRYLLLDNNEWLPDSLRALRYTSRRGFFRHFYKTPAHFFEVNTADFRLRLNPMLNLEIGGSANDSAVIFQNQRGLELRGDVDGKLFFYTSVLETQARFPNYVVQRIGESRALPGAGFYKPSFESKILGVRDAYDFNIATAYVGFQATRHFGIQIGHGKHFIGNGHRSLFLSDFSAPTFFLKFDTRVWRFHYQNLFLELSPVSQVQVPDGVLLPKKYLAAHYLNFKVTPRLAFGFYEATVFNRSRQFELQYLNPVIFYRSVEGMLGSPDNVLLGLDGRWNLLRRLQLYGQFMLDELVVSELFGRKGWWANKWGIQMGLKYVNVLGINHLDLQLEHNRARPFTYAHADPHNSYTHYNQPLAHPLGANFAETILVLDARPVSRLFLRAKFIVAKSGENEMGENWGADPLLSYETRVRDFGNEIGQGISANTVFVSLRATWSLWHNAYLEVHYNWRDKASAHADRDLRTQVFALGFRMNVWSTGYDF